MEPKNRNRNSIFTSQNNQRKFGEKNIHDSRTTKNE